MEGDASSPEPMVYSFIYLCQESPIKEPSHEKWEKPMVPHAEGRPTYNGVQPGSPRGLL